MVGNPLVAGASERIRLGIVLQQNRSAQTDVLKRPKFFSLKIYFKPLSTLYCITRISLSLTQLLQMPSKNKTLPLHVSRALIEAERNNVVLRTQRRIALLRATEDPRHHHDDEDPITIHTVDSHYCLNIFCFCVSLLTMNLLFLQWLYYKVHNYKYCKPFVYLYLFGYIGCT